MMRNKNIPIFVPHAGCPNDCAFCNQRRITGVMDVPSPDDVARLIRDSLPHMREGDHVEVAFFGGSFTGIPRNTQAALLGAVRPFLRAGQLDGIRLSTRPDYIDEDILDFLAPFGVTTIELGAQSMCDEVLLANRRGHTAADTVRASRLIRAHGFSLGLQMMPGLYRDTAARTLATAEALVALAPDFVRIYPTLVLKGTYLADLYETGRYTPLWLEEAVAQCVTLKRMFAAHNIPVIRMGLMASDAICADGDVLAGPFHPAFGELVESAAYFEEIAAQLADMPDGEVEIVVPPHLVSKVVGNRRRNLYAWQRQFPGKRIRIRQDAAASACRVETGIVGSKQCF